MNQNTNNTQTIENVCEFLNEQMQFFEQTAEVQRAIDNLMEAITLYFNAEAALLYKKDEDRYTLAISASIPGGIKISYDDQISYLEIQNPYVIGSPLYVKQIFINVITNAIQYNRIGGSVW